MTTASAGLDLATVYPRVQQFYAAQMQRLDSRDIVGYAGTFSDDAEFAHTPGRPPSRTRAGIIEDLTDFHRKFSDDPMQRRHLVTMINLEPLDDGRLRSTAYCLVVKVRPGQEPVFVSCTMHDILVELDGELLNASRHVSYD
ncbi:Actinorhodin biosynthesis protein ActVIA [Frankia canadensis]|uniref:Actinorhodin biosynthesis protein ActVIA n=1 Tax=Frankia canadensis TaxID=1836972 RepID=A0A2I2KND2_9ACTN|nr:nuclear transport factor 2 family protein [Frankia canadensis]SNQ47159.1 Actinorhodin biosynthesis protein ActVIA [Frankia canadensis]SOU54449.1 Actinorhodin biosynthesis protein ActVIA [Frankia canadensis]